MSHTLLHRVMNAFTGTPEEFGVTLADATMPRGMWVGDEERTQRRQDAATRIRSVPEGTDLLFVEELRRDSRVGRGSCSVIDECYTDDELLEAVGETRSVVQAKKILRRIDRTHREIDRERQYE